MNQIASSLLLKKAGGLLAADGQALKSEFIVLMQAAHLNEVFIPGWGRIVLSGQELTITIEPRPAPGPFI